MTEERIGILEGEFNDLLDKALEEGATHYEDLNGSHIAMWGLWRGVDGDEPGYALLMKAVGRPGYLLSGWAGMYPEEIWGDPDLRPVTELREPELC